MNISKIQDLIIVALLSAIVAYFVSVISVDRAVPVFSLTDFVRIADFQGITEKTKDLDQDQRDRALTAYMRKIQDIAQKGYLVLDGRQILFTPSEMVVPIENGDDGTQKP